MFRGSYDMSRLTSHITVLTTPDNEAGANVINSTTAVCLGGRCRQQKTGYFSPCTRQVG